MLHSSQLNLKQLHVFINGKIINDYNEFSIDYRDTADQLRNKKKMSEWKKSASYVYFG